MVEGLELEDGHAVAGAEDPHQGEAAAAGGGDDHVLPVEHGDGDADAALEALEGVDLTQE